MTNYQKINFLQDKISSVVTYPQKLNITYE